MSPADAAPHLQVGRDHLARVEARRRLLPRCVLLVQFVRSQPHPKSPLKCPERNVSDGGGFLLWTRIGAMMTVAADSPPVLMDANEITDCAAGEAFGALEQRF